MIDKLHKIICYTLIFTLFNTSFQPTYAFPDFDDDVKDVSSRKLASRSVNAGDEFQVNQNTSSSQFFSKAVSVASSPKGEIFITWVGDSDIFGRRLFSNETFISNESCINQVKVGNQWSPSATFLIDGSLSVCWEGYQTGYANIYCRNLFPNETARTPEFGINDITTTAEYNHYPVIISLPDGNGAVIWMSAITGFYNVYNRIVSVNGALLSNEIPVSQIISGKTQFLPSAALFNNSLMIVWQGNQAGNYDIYGREALLSGAVSGNPLLISQTSTGLQYSTSTAVHSGPSVASSNDGNAFVAWPSDQTGNSHIYARILFPNKTFSANQFQVNQNMTGNQGYPFSVRLGNNDTVVLWQDDQLGIWQIFARAFSPNGIPRGDEVRVSQNTIGDNYYPSGARLPNDDLVVAWVRNQTAKFDIFARILPHSSFLYPAPVPAPAPAPALLPSPLPAPLPSPRPAPAPVLAPAPLPAPTSELAPAPVPSPIFTPSLFTQPSSETNSLSFSELSTYMLTTPSSSLPFSSSSTVLWDSSSSSLEALTTSPSGRTTAIIGGAAGGAFLIIAVVVAILVKVCCFSGGHKKEAPDSSPVDEEDVEDVEEKEESSTPPPPTGPDRMTATNVSRHVNEQRKKHGDQQYVVFSGMSKVADDNPDDPGYQYVELSSLPPSTQAE